MTQPSGSRLPSPISLPGLAAVCMVAAILTTVASRPLGVSLGVTGTVVAIAVLWVIAIVEVTAWRRVAPTRTLGITGLGLSDAMIAMAAGLVLAIAVPLLSVGAARFTGYATGTVETAAQLNVEIAILGVVTAAVTEEIIYRAAAMCALSALRAPTAVVLLVPALLFTLTHWSWGLAHMTFVVFPLSLALGALFLWRRSLPLNIIAHLIADLPVIVLEAIASA